MPRLAPLKRKKFEKFLKYVGCYLKRAEGDHLIYDRAGLERPVFIIRNNLRTLKINLDEYLEVLKEL